MVSFLRSFTFVPYPLFEPVLFLSREKKGLVEAFRAADQGTVSPQCFNILLFFAMSRRPRVLRRDEHIPIGVKIAVQSDPSMVSGSPTPRSFCVSSAPPLPGIL